MTTNVIDRKKRILASDSRWSVQISPKHIFYVDDTGFDKIGDRTFGSIICAGDSHLIDEWKSWFYTPVLNTAAMPRTHRMHLNQCMSITMSVWVKPACTVLTSQGWYENHGEDAKFSGSGAVYAKDCYIKNKCGKTAVQSASQLDYWTGGEVKFVEFETGRHNLADRYVPLAEVFQLLHERGMVMDTDTKTVVPNQEFNLGGTDIVRAIASGEIVLSAPTGQPARPWLDSEREELKKAFDHIAALEAEAASR